MGPHCHFICCDQEFKPGDEIKNHLREKHGITEFKGTRKMTLHLDAADHHYTQYECEVGGLKLVQSVNVMREKFGKRR